MVSTDILVDPTYILKIVRLTIDDEVLGKLSRQFWTGTSVHGLVAKVHPGFIEVAELQRHFIKRTLYWAYGTGGIGAAVQQYQNRFHS